MKYQILLLSLLCIFVWVAGVFCVMCGYQALFGPPPFSTSGINEKIFNDFYITEYKPLRNQKSPEYVITHKSTGEKFVIVKFNSYPSLEE